MDITKLSAPFPESDVHWRAQNLTQKGDKALALAYLDARDVMNRLDEVCGPENWQDTYAETPSGRVICSLSIRLGDWVTKSDGAGDTDFEGAKGGLSDAFKRAAVKWGIGRYLYSLGNIWVPCETWTGNDGKARWKKWTDNPWNYVFRRNAAAAGGSGAGQARDDAIEDASDTPQGKAMAARDMICNDLRKMKSIKGLNQCWGKWQKHIDRLADNYPELHGDVLHTYTATETVINGENE